MQEQKIGTSDLEIETYYYDEREYLKGKYYNLSNITPNIFNCTFEKSVVKNKNKKGRSIRIRIETSIPISFV